MDVCGFGIETDSVVFKPTTDYSVYKERLDTFKTWPMQMKQSAEEMAQAGLYYTKTGDMCVCFKCNIRLKQWTSYDIPWVEHMKWSPKCEYLLMVGKPPYPEKSKQKFVAGFPV